MNADRGIIDRGIIYVLLDHFARHLYPRAIAIDASPGCERVATACAERRSERKNGVPATAADRSLRWLVERLVARRTGGREDDAQHRVERGGYSKP